MIYVETDCTITGPTGHTFEAVGAVVTPEFAIGYPKCNRMQDWHGNDLGSCRVVASWPMPGQWYGTPDRLYQIEATINGVTYTGRGQGDGMIWKGKRKRSAR